MAEEETILTAETPEVATNEEQSENSTETTEASQPTESTESDAASKEEGQEETEVAGAPEEYGTFDLPENFDMNNDKYRRIKRRIKYVKRFPDDKQDIEGLKLIFYDNNMEELFVSRLEILGKYCTLLVGESLLTLPNSCTELLNCF